MSVLLILSTLGSNQAEAATTTAAAAKAVKEK
jgi:hypothetical protein